METQEIDFKKLLEPWSEPQLIEKLPEENYHAEFALSAGRMKRIHEDSVANFRQSFLEEKKDPSPAMRFGSLFHKAALEGPEFLKNYRVMPEFTGKTKDGKDSNRSAEALEKKKRWLGDLSPEVILIDSMDELDQVAGMINSILAHPIAKKLMVGGKRELSGYFNLEGFRCKMRIDILTQNGLMVDLKTAIKAGPRRFPKDAWSRLYPIQAAFYRRGLSILTGRTVETFDYIVVEKEPPYRVEVYSPNEDYFSIGDHIVDLSMRRLRQAIESNDWYPDQEPKILDVPKWAMRELEEDGGL